MEIIKQCKICTSCNEEKPFDEFYYQSKVNAKGENYKYHLPECKECTKKRSYGWQVNNRKRRSNLQMKYARTPKGKKVSNNAQKNYRDSGKLTDWQHNNPEKLKEYSERRSNKKHEITKNEWENCKNYFNYRCSYCGLAIEEHLVKYKGKVIIGDLHRDHVDDAGANDLSNCVPSCKSCNASKGEYELESWYNVSNLNFTQERLNKIVKWLEVDYIKYKNK